MLSFAWADVWQLLMRLLLLFVMEKKGVVTGLYGVVRRVYTVASFAALSWLVQGGCTACYVISVPLVLCSSLFCTLVFLGVRRTMSAREEERTQEKGRRRTGGGEEEGRRRPGGGQEEGPHHPNPKVLLCGCVFCI